MSKDEVKAKVIDQMLLGRNMYVGSMITPERKVWKLYVPELPSPANALFIWEGEHEWWWSDPTLKEALEIIDQHWDNRVDEREDA